MRARKPFCFLLSLLAALLLALPARAADGGNHFVLCDQLLGQPAVCYPLEPGWEGMGAIVWNGANRNNAFQMYTILFNPAAHQLAQVVMSPVNQQMLFTPDVLAPLQNPDLMAQRVAQEINAGIVVPGLANFVAKGGRFSNDVPEKERRLLAPTLNRMAQIGMQARLFAFDAAFDCVYNGAPCEAWYHCFFLVHFTQVRPNVPAVGAILRSDIQLALGPGGGGLAAARTAGGRMFGSAFMNATWKYAADRMAQAIATGRQIGREEGMALMREAQQNTAATMDRVRKGWSEVIREVKTVDNPLAPGQKIERPIHFDHSWINSAGDKLLLSDRNLEPNTMRGLIEQGHWTPVD